MNVKLRRTVSGECLLFFFMLAFGFIFTIFLVVTNGHRSIHNAISRFSSDLLSGRLAAWVLFLFPYVAFLGVRILAWVAKVLKARLNK